MITIKTYHDDNGQDDELMSCPVAEGGMQPLRTPSNWFVATLASGNNPLLRRINTRTRMTM